LNSTLNKNNNVGLPTENVTTLLSSVKLKRSNDDTNGQENQKSSTHSGTDNQDDDEEDEEEEVEVEEEDDDSDGNDIAAAAAAKSNRQRNYSRDPNQQQPSANSFESGSSSSSSSAAATNDNVDYVMHSPRTVSTKYGSLQGIVITFVRYADTHKPSSDKSSSSSPPPPSVASSSTANTVPPVTLTPVEAFLGVPYASPPSGNLRFMPPVAPVHWRGVRQANHLSPVCPQPLVKLLNSTTTSTTFSPSDNPEQLNRNFSQRYYDRLTRQLPYLRNQSEDCLYLNIYVPFEQYYQQRHTFRQQPSSNNKSTNQRNKHRNKGKWQNI